MAFPPNKYIPSSVAHMCINTLYCIGRYICGTVSSGTPNIHICINIHIFMGKGGTIYIYISSDGADHVSLKLGPKSGTYQPAIDVCFSKHVLQTCLAKSTIAVDYPFSFLDNVCTFVHFGSVLCSCVHMVCIA